MAWQAWRCRDKFEADRISVIDALNEDLTHRFVKVLSDPILGAFKVFDHRHWPVHETTLQDYGVDKITQLQEIYGEFLLDDMENELLDQWSDMKVTIMKSEGLRNRDFHDLWAQMLVQYNSHYTYVLRLVAIALMVPVDTSECERVFSLMNDLKTSERNALGQANLRNLMVWHTAAKDLACADLPVMSSLKKFRELSSSSTKGRYAHRPTEPPVYDYEETMS